MSFMAQPTLAFIPMDQTINGSFFNCYSTAHSILISRGILHTDTHRLLTSTAV